MSTAYDFFSFGFNQFLFSHQLYILFFLLSLYCIYLGQELKNIIQLALTFTAGYLVSLVLGAYDILFIPDHILAILLPAAVFVTAFSNFFFRQNKFVNRFPSQTYRFFFSIIFGIVFGIALAANLSTPWQDGGSHISRLLLYVLGTVCGHLVFLLGYLIALFFVRDLFKVSRREWIIFCTGAMIALSLKKLIFLLF